MAAPPRNGSKAVIWKYVCLPARMSVSIWCEADTVLKDAARWEVLTPLSLGEGTRQPPPHPAIWANTLQSSGGNSPSDTLRRERLFWKNRSIQKEGTSHTVLTSPSAKSKMPLQPPRRLPGPAHLPGHAPEVSNQPGEGQSSSRLGRTAGSPARFG